MPGGNVRFAVDKLCNGDEGGVGIEKGSHKFPTSLLPPEGQDSSFFYCSDATECPTL